MGYTGTDSFRREPAAVSERPSRCDDTPMDITVLFLEKSDPLCLFDSLVIEAIQARASASYDLREDTSIMCMLEKKFQAMRTPYLMTRNGRRETGNLCTFFGSKQASVPTPAFSVKVTHAVTSGHFRKAVFNAASQFTSYPNKYFL